jgi:hypothetical protein
LSDCDGNYNTACYLALLRQVSERIEDHVAQVMQESTDADEEELVRRLLSAFTHTLVDDPRVAMVTFGAAAGISPRVEAQRRENRRWAAPFIESLWRSPIFCTRLIRHGPGRSTI